MLNALTIDVEEHFQVHAFESVIDRSQWERHPSRVEGNTRRVLELLKERGARATFFVLGWVAERHPALVKEIAAAGHELATHGYWHDLVYRQTPKEFADDLCASVVAIERAADGAHVVGYRAPSFSITESSLWALDVLRYHGLAYDSSIFPLVAHDRYGIRHARRFAYRLGGGLLEVPISTVRWAGLNLPVGGGGYFRLFPLWVTDRAIRHLNGEGQPAVMYLHPWELDPEQPTVTAAPLLSRFRHYVNLDKTERRLSEVLQRFQFSSLNTVFAEGLAGSA